MRSRFDEQLAKLKHELIEMGALMQVNAGSIEGRNGFILKQKVLGWIKKGYIHFVASDGHNLDTRPLSMQKAARTVEKKFGQEEAQKLFYDHARMVIAGEYIRV